MFALGEFVHSIFATIDFCAIYLLIAGKLLDLLDLPQDTHPRVPSSCPGTYTPFLAILFPDKPLYSVGLLGSLWAMAAGGVALTVVYRGPFKVIRRDIRRDTASLHDAIRRPTCHIRQLPHMAGGPAYLFVRRHGLGVPHLRA